MKQIVVLSNMYPTKNHPTFGIFVENQVRQLQKAGVDLKVIAIDEPGKGKVLTLKKYLSWFMQSMKYLLLNKKRISLSHAHYVFPTGILSLIGKKIFNIPYIVTVHGGDIDKMPNKHPLIKKMTGLILNNAEKIITVGERLKDDVAGQFQVPEKRIEVLSMGVDTQVFHEVSKETTRDLLNLKHDENMILFVGNVIREKGVYELIEAYAQLKEQYSNSSLYILGSQRDIAYLQKLTSLIEAKGIQDVHFKPPMPQDVLAKWMASANVLALPSYHEGFGLVALEAMASGTPVVGSDVGGLSYLLNSGAGILVPPKDIDALAKGIEKALFDENQSIDKEKMQLMIETHSSENILKRLLEIYGEMNKGQS